MRTDNVLLDVTELRMNWAVDDVANGITELLEHLENRKDLEGLEAFAKLVRAMNTYVQVVRQSVEALPAPPIRGDK